MRPKLVARIWKLDPLPPNKRTQALDLVEVDGRMRMKWTPFNGVPVLFKEDDIIRGMTVPQFIQNYLDGRYDVLCWSETHYQCFIQPDEKIKAACNRLIEESKNA